MWSSRGRGSLACLSRYSPARSDGSERGRSPRSSSWLRVAPLRGRRIEGFLGPLRPADLDLVRLTSPRFVDLASCLARGSIRRDDPGGSGVASLATLLSGG